MKRSLSRKNKSVAFSKYYPKEWWRNVCVFDFLRSEHFTTVSKPQYREIKNLKTVQRVAGEIVSIIRMVNWHNTFNSQHYRKD